MNNVFMIAYHFPPEGNAGAYRPLRFVRNLPAVGWRPTVVTIKTNSYERYDPALLNEIPPGLNVIRVGNPDPWQALQARRNFRSRELQKQISNEEMAKLRRAQGRTLRSWLRRRIRTAEAWCYHPDLAMGWIRPAAKAIVGASDGEKVNVIWATAGPVSSFIAAHRASQRTGVPYVLDFRDAWTITFNDFEARQPHWAQRRAQNSMYRVLKEARAVVFRYESEAECFWRAYPKALGIAKVHIIPNGFDGDMQPYRAPAQTNKCRILYTGTLRDYRYDTLLLALRALKEDMPELADCLQLQFIGEDNDKLGAMAASFDLGPMVTISGTVGFNHVNRLSTEAHALLVLGRYPTMRGYELFAPAKLFAYLAAGRPIIGILPADEAKRILSEIGVTTIADVDSVSEIVSVLRILLESWKKQSLAALVPDAAACYRYSADHQTRQLAHALAGQPASEPFVPGRTHIPPSLKEELQKIASAIDESKVSHRYFEASPQNNV